MHQSLDIEIVLFDVTTYLKFFLLLVDVGNVSEHVTSAVSPSNGLWEGNCDLSEQRVDIGIAMECVNGHKLMPISEFRIEIPIEQFLDLWLFLAGSVFQML